MFIYTIMLADFNSAVVWMVFIIPLISSYSLLKKKRQKYEQED